MLFNSIFSTRRSSRSSDRALYVIFFILKCFRKEFSLSAKSHFFYSSTLFSWRSIFFHCNTIFPSILFNYFHQVRMLQRYCFFSNYIKSMSLHEDAHKCLSLPHERYRFVIYSYRTSKKLRQGISKPSGERIRITFNHRYYRSGLKLFRINTIRI